MISELWSLLCEIALWCWIASAIGFIFSAFPSRDNFRKGPATVWGGCLILFYAFWVVGMVAI